MTTTTNYNLETYAPASTATFYEFLQAIMGATGTSNMEKIDALIEDFTNRIQYKRQGGSSTIWNTPGATNQTPPSGIYMQYGNAATIDSPNGLISVTFPVAFAYAPLVFAMTRSDVHVASNLIHSVTIGTVTASGFTGRYKYFFSSPATVNQGTVTFDIAINKAVLSHVYWIAIGPKA